MSRSLQAVDVGGAALAELGRQHLQALSHGPGSRVFACTVAISGILGFASAAEKWVQIVALVAGVFVYAFSLTAPFIEGGFIARSTAAGVLARVDGRDRPDRQHHFSCSRCAARALGRVRLRCNLDWRLHGVTVYPRAACAGGTHSPQPD
jgi:hypothetical protein